MTTHWKISINQFLQYYTEALSAGCWSLTRKPCWVRGSLLITSANPINSPAEGAADDMFFIYVWYYSPISQPSNPSDPVSLWNVLVRRVGAYPLLHAATATQSSLTNGQGVRGWHTPSFPRRLSPELYRARSQKQSWFTTEPSKTSTIAFSPSGEEGRANLALFSVSTAVKFGFDWLKEFTIIEVMT